MPVYGSILEDGAILIDRVEVEWNPKPWSGRLSYVFGDDGGEVARGKIYTLRLDEPLEDGSDSRKIEIWSGPTKHWSGAIGEPPTHTATFNPAQP